jgi:mannose-1-phosphate guanylyltransferase
MAIIPVILSGGGGTRLWPLSTPNCPKQFLPLTDKRTMFQLTLERVEDEALFAAPLIVANAAHAALVDTQLEDRAATILLEPHARNTAPAIALAALAAPDPKSMLLVMPSDHVIADLPAFHAAISAALPPVEQGWMATFGIEPTGPETGYGYIRMGAELAGGVRQVERFVEKPDLARAQALLAEGNHSWNGGIFLMRADIYLAALGTHAPDILAATQASMESTVHDGNHIMPDATAFAICPSDSIDYAVMEPAERVAVVPVNMGWSDVGSWDALYEIGHKDEAANSSSGPVRLSDANGNLIHADGVRVSVHGVDDLIIVANGRDVMILPRGTSQKVRDFASD